MTKEQMLLAEYGIETLEHIEYVLSELSCVMSALHHYGLSIEETEDLYVKLESAAVSTGLLS